jgi:hypothetical protein
MRVALSSALPEVARLPSVVVVEEGKVEASFTITTRAVLNDTHVRVSAASACAPNARVTSGLTVNEPDMLRVDVPERMACRETRDAAVVLASAAPDEGYPVRMSRPSAALDHPEIVRVAAGETVGRFRLTSKGMGGRHTVHGYAGNVGRLGVVHVDCP